MTSIGKVRDVTAEFHFEWQIDDFFSLPGKDGESYNSPSFSFEGESWYFQIYPHGESEDNSVGYIGAYLFRKLDGAPISLAWSLGVKTFEGKRDQEMQFTHVFEKTEGRRSPKFLKRSDLSEKKSELMPSDVLTLVCHIEYYSKSKDAVVGIVQCYHCEDDLVPECASAHEKNCLDKTVRCPKCGNVVAFRNWFDHECDTTRVEGYITIVQCSHCKDDLVAECASSHEKKCLAKTVRCPTCGNVVPFRNSFDHECDTTRVEAIEKHVEDLTDLIDSEEHSDVTICVKDKEFRLHRSILAIRNPYFNSMFKTEMKEKNTGIVSIDDCEPDIFQSFIYFVYTGKVQTLSYDNVCALYEVADKYQQDQLKSECLCYMKNGISVDSFCDFTVLALRHDEKELLQKATDLYCRKTKEIVQSVKWQTFMREYPTQANELYIKALNYSAKLLAMK